MARWKLMQPHYLNIPDTVWEYTETDRKTGKPKRHKFPVPTYLNPNEAEDCNYQDGEEPIVIVTNRADPAFPKDYVFTGDPTPDMEPMDDEARAISAKFADRWQHPIEGLPATGGQSYSQSLLDNLQVQVAQVAAHGAAQQAEGMKELLTSMAAMMKQNQELIAALAQNAVPATRRA